MWNEQDHPRDEDGKFTFKNRENGSNTKESPADVLYHHSKIKAEKDKQESEYKSKLLNILSNKAKPTDVLYGTTKELEEKVKEYGLQDKLKGTMTGGASNVYMSPINRMKDNNQYMTPIEEMYKRQRGYSPNPNYKVDNSEFTDDMIKKAREFIQGKEKFVSNAYKPTPNDVWTIGYGHTKNVKPGDRITKEEAEKLYRQDFKEHADALKAVKVPLTKNQKIALSSFAFNMGATGFKNSDVVRILNTGDYEGAAKELLNYNKQKGKFLKGLDNRRRAENKLFLTPDD